MIVAATPLLVSIAYLCFHTGVTRAQTISPSITPARVEVDTALARGNEHELPTLVVRNQGDGAMLIQMSTAFAGSEMSPVDSRSWIQFTPQQFEVQPGVAQAVAVRVHVPREAGTGRHALLLRAGPAPVPAGDGVSIGVSAFVATTLTFEVGAEVLESPSLPIYYLAAVGLAIAVGACSYYVTAWVRGFEVLVRRKRPEHKPEELNRLDSSLTTAEREHNDA